jgi:hypothetical protein
MTTAATNLTAALALADAGFRTFPAWAIYNPATQRWNKPPCIQNWQSLATDDPGQITRWWRQYPDAIPAICSEQLVVIDADRHPDGPDGVAALTVLANSHEWPMHPVVLTPSDGQHHYFGQPNPALGNRTGQLPPGIDVRGLGGFVIGPGAVLPDGTEWLLPPNHSTDLPRLPPWLERMVRGDDNQPANSPEISNHAITNREERFAEAALAGCTAQVENAARGSRNTILNNVAYRLGRMIARGWLDRNRVEVRLLRAANQLQHDDGVIAVKATIKSGLDAGCLNRHPDLVDRKWGGE